MKPPRNAPACPAHLSPAARAEWDRMSGMLHPLGLLTEIDGEQLALYAVACARWMEAERHLAAGGTIITTPNGHKQASPWLSIANGAMRQMYWYLAKFGLTPADRSRVNPSPPPREMPKAHDAEPILKIAE